VAPELRLPLLARRLTSLLSPSRDKETTMSNKQHSPNDQRGIVKNPNNPAYTADRANRIQQGHANPPPAPAPAQPSGREKGKAK